MEFEQTYANYLDEGNVKEIQALEKEIGKTIIAYSTPPVVASLTDDQLNKIQELEKKLCVRLVAYKTHD